MENPILEKIKSKLKPPEAESLSTPDGFAHGVLGMDLYPKQRAVLRALQPPGCAVAFRSCNEGGKTRRVITAAILWHLVMFPKGVVKVTSGSWNQIETQLIPALAGYQHKFPSFRFLAKGIETPDPAGFMTCISTKEPGRFEGAHADDDAPLLIIVDEAKTVGEEIFGAIDRCRPTRLMLASSTGFAEGEFYKAFTSRAALYQRFTQVATDCPHIPPEHIAAMEAKWGKDHPLVKSMLWAEFMQQVEDAVVNMGALERLLADPPEFDNKNERKAGCDFAAGGDENTFAVREGNRVRLVKCWRDSNTMSAVGQFITLFKRENLKPGEIEGDADGLGKPMVDALHEAGWPIGYWHGGQAPRWDDHYADLWAESWFGLSRQIDGRGLILPNDDDLRGQLLVRKQRYNSKGKLGLESKKDMRARGLPSPDRADAVAIACAPVKYSVEAHRAPVRSWLEQARELGEGDAQSGFNAGE